MSSIFSLQDALGREWFLAAVLFVPLVGSAVIGQLRRRGQPGSAAMLTAVGFGLTVVVTIWLTLRPLVPIGEASRVAILDPVEGAWGWSSIAWRPVIDNVALFVPVGAFAAAAWPRRNLLLIWLGCVVASVGIEALQYLVPTGRVANAADVVANAAGALIGVMIALITRSRPGLRRTASRRARPVPTGRG